MSNLNEIKTALSNYFGSVVSVEKLGTPNRSKTVSRAKSVGVYIARKNGHKNEDIAEAFGYESHKTVSRINSKIVRDVAGNFELQHDIDKINEELSL